MNASFHRPNRQPRARRTGVITLFALAAVAAPLLAHPGHDDAPGEEKEAAAGPVSISAEARRNLGLKTEEAESRTLDKTSLAVGQITAIPGRQAVVASRIAGRVVSLPFEPGQPVRKGEVVVEVESFQVGNPPPRVRYEAPMDGVVVGRDVFLGSSVNPDSRILTLADTREVFAEASVSEGQLRLVRAGQAVRVRLTAFPGEVFAGTVERLDAALDPATRTLRVWSRVANPDGRLRPNLQAEVTFVTDAAENVTAVPRSAVLEGDGGVRFVFVEKEEAAPGGAAVFERREVVTGVNDDRFVEITEGVFPGDKVVTQGNYQLQYVRSAAKPSAAPASADAKEERGEKSGARATTATPEGWRNQLGQPLVWALGGALLISLGVNVALARRPRASAPTAPTPAAPASRSAAPKPEREAASRA